MSIQLRDHTCKDCKFWDWTQNFLNHPIMVPRKEDSKEGDVLRMGRCRRRAPNPHFASSREDDWCGEFEMKNTKDL